MWSYEFAPSIGKYIPPPKISGRLYLHYSKRPLPSRPTAQELEEVQHGPQWPFMHISRFALPEPVDIAPGDCILEVNLPSDDDDSSYMPSVSEDDSEGSTDSGEYEVVDSVSEAELEDLDADRQCAFSPPKQSEMDQAIKARDDAILARDIGRLEAAEAECAATYNPGEVVALFTQFFEVIVDMGHWPQGCIQYAPHTQLSVNVQVAKELGYEQQAIELMEKLPYLQNGTERHGTYIVPESRFADYRKEGDLRSGRRPMVPFGDGHPLLDPWILPLVIPGWYGYVILLDTRLGAVRSYTPYDGPADYTPEWKRHSKYEEEDRSKWTHEYRRAPLISVREWFIDMIEAYRTLERLPMILAEDNDPRMERNQGNTDADADADINPGADSENKLDDNDWFKAMQNERREKQLALPTLYRECGWPENWQREEFLTKWQNLNKSLNPRAYQRRKQVSK